MACARCAIAALETLAEAAVVCGVVPDVVLADLSEALGNGTGAGMARDGEPKPDGP
jgi:hypothetical protein